MPGAKAVLLTHNETSTGVMNPIAELAAAVRDEAPDALILVDSVSGLGRRAVRDGRLGRRRRRHRLAEGLDVRAGPGHDRRLARGPGRPWRRATMPRFYLDLRAHRDATPDGQTPLTPAIAVVYQVDEGLRLMTAEGKDASSPATRPAPPRRGPGWPPSASSCSPTRRIASKTVTAAIVPDDLDWKAFNGEVKRRGVVLAGGQGKLTGKIFRLGHLGSVTLEEILGAIEHARDRLARRRAGRSRRARRSPPPRSRRSSRWASPRRPPSGRAREGPRRRARRQRGHRAPPRRTTRSTSARAARRDELCAILPDYDALIVRSQVQVDADADRRRHAARRHRPGRGRRRQRRPRRGDAGRASRSSTPRPATRSRPPSTPSRCCTASPAGRRAADASVRRGEWKRAQFTGLELRGRTLGIVGLGKIGQAIAVRARAMEMTVVGVDPFVTAEQAANHGVELVDFDELLARADVVTVHVPLTPRDARAHRARRDREAEARLDRPQRRPRRRRRRGRGGRGAAVGPSRRRRHRRLRARAADRLAAARRAEHAADAASRRVDRRGPGPRLRGGRRAGPRRPRRPERPVRGQRPAADAGDGPGDRAVPAARRGPRPVLRPVLARRRPDAHARDRRRARRVRRRRR